MSNRLITADKIFDGEVFRENISLEINANGTIDNILQGKKDAEYFKGIITPGFVNCHCHLELSHLKGLIPKHIGLKNFVTSVMQNRNFSSTIIHDFAKQLDAYIWQKGIVAVGDICNTTDTISVKKESKIAYRNFIETTGFLPSLAEKRMQNSENIASVFLQENLDASIVPHAPYSVSEKLFELINVHSEGKIISIHNQESKEEDLFFREKKGDFISLYKMMNADISFFEKSAKSGLQRILPLLNKAKKILLVHNTFTAEEDIFFAEKWAKENGISLFWTLCPNANLYIENRLPPIALFIKHNCKICLGTDSLSSNDDLDITAEMQTLKKHFPEIKNEWLLQAATANGASALGFGNFGKIKKGFASGLNLIDNDFNFVQKII